MGQEVRFTGTAGSVGRVDGPGSTDSAGRLGVFDRSGVAGLRAGEVAS